MHIGSNITMEIPELLGLVIQDAFDDYKIKVLEIQNDGFINSEREGKIIRDLVDIVSERISPATMDKLSLFYKPESIAAVMADKIYITVLSYIVDHNKEFVNPESNT